MSAESMLAFYGLRFEIADDEIISIEDRKHPLQIKAKQSGLKTYWGKFGTYGGKYLFFIGDQIGILGIENDEEVQLTFEDLAHRAEDTNDRLQRAGFVERPMIYLAWEPDQ